MKPGGRRWAPWAWTAALGLLVAGLAVQAVHATREGGEHRRRGAGLDREIRRMRSENRALRDEVQALQGDPVYLESLLRRRKKAGTGEWIVE